MAEPNKSDLLNNNVIDVKNDIEMIATKNSISINGGTMQSNGSIAKQSPIQSSATLRSPSVQLQTPPLAPKLESDEKIKMPSEFSLGVLIVRILMIVFDVITFPIYYLIQRPWVRLEKQRKVRARLENPNDPHSPYVRCNGGVGNHYIYKAETLPELLQLMVKLNPKSMPLLGRRQITNVITETLSNGKRLMKFKMTDYQWMTVGEIHKQIIDLSKAFADEGVGFQEKILIFSETRLEWFLCAQALLRVGAIITTLYTTLGLKSICHGIQETEVEKIITTSDLLPMLLKIIDKTTNVKKIYVIDLHPGLLKSDPVEEKDFNDILASQNRSITMISFNDLLDKDTALILYTSGSTGNPKGVILTHKNVVATIHAACHSIDDIIQEADQHVFYGLLPLAHVFEFILEQTFFSLGIRIGYGTPYTMTDDSTAIYPGQKGDLKMLRPTIMAGVPLILDRVRKTLTARFERKKSIFWKQLIKFSVAYKNYWIDRGFDTPIINHTICKRLNGNLGGRVRYMVAGGAPLSAETHRMMRAFLNIQIVIGYGSSETCGASTMMEIDDLSISNIGSPLHGVKIRLVDWPEGGYSVHDKPYPRGELVIGGPTISNGYFKLPDKTMESYEDIDGTKWFKMGDIGEVDEIGTFRIIDRKKDLIKLQFGEYISLGKIEAELKNFIYIENVCVYGDSMHTYTIALIQPARSMLKRLANDLGKSNLTFEQICSDQTINKIVIDKLREFCFENGLHKMETPQKIRLCPEEWSINNGFLTASMKIKRRDIQKFYAKQIDELYGRI
ncbi:Long-chain-fatty-acid--CoA ligase 4 [Sarcoptes scabiei]|nr:Long-chain-fatty-acid--CoA ligase 4 [Sarcoptes scabiei]